MAIIGYDPEKEEVPNADKIKNCFSLSIFMLLALPLFGLIFYFLKGWIINQGYLTETGSKELFKGYKVIAVFLTVSIILILGYLRRKLKKEAQQKDEKEA